MSFFDKLKNSNFVFDLFWLLFTYSFNVSSYWELALWLDVHKPAKLTSINNLLTLSQLLTKKALFDPEIRPLSRSWMFGPFRLYGIQCVKNPLKLDLFRAKSAARWGYYSETLVTESDNFRQVINDIIYRLGNTKCKIFFKKQLIFSFDLSKILHLALPTRYILSYDMIYTLPSAVIQLVLILNIIFYLHRNTSFFSYRISDFFFVNFLQFANLFFYV